MWWYFGRRLLRLDWSKPLPFEMFVDMATATNRSPIGEQHWLMMDKLLPRSAMSIDYVGRVESLEADLKPVLERLGRSAATIPRLNASRGRRGSHGDWISEDLRKKIFAAYRGDFERFGYSERLPD